MYEIMQQLPQVFRLRELLHGAERNIREFLL